MKIMYELALSLLVILLSFDFTQAFKLPNINIAKKAKYPLWNFHLEATSNNGAETLFNGVQKVGGQITSSKPYTALEALVVLALLSGIDGGFSGDWSRYGLISASEEELIRNTIGAVGYFHILACLPFVVIVTKQRGQPVVPAALRTLLIGGLSALKVLFAVKEEDAIRFPDLSNLVAQLSVLSQQGPFARLKQLLASAAAGSYDSAAVQSAIDGYISDNPCVLFSFTSCPYCIKAKNILIDEYGATVKVVELDVDKKTGYPIRAELGKRTGRTSVPSIWIGGRFIGGCNDGPVISLSNSGSSTTVEQSGAGGLVALAESGSLRDLLAAAGAIPVAKKSSDIDSLDGSPLLRFFGPDSMNAARPILFFSLPFLLYLVSSIFATNNNF